MIRRLLLLVLFVLMVACSAAQAQDGYYHGTFYDGRNYRPCPRVDPWCELLPRQGFPLQPLPKERREAYQAAHDLALRQRANIDRPPGPPRQQTQPRLNKEQWKQAIIEEGNKFCTTFPNDEICHFKESAPNAQ